MYVTTAVCMKSTSTLKRLYDITYALCLEDELEKPNHRYMFLFCSSLIVRNENCISTKSIYHMATINDFILCTFLFPRSL